MNDNRSKNSIRNINAGVIFKFLQIIFGFVIRTVMIKTLGIEYLGLNSLFTSIPQMLSLAELGFGNAIVFSMYKPIAENNVEKIRALLNAYRKFYHIVGLMVLGIGLLLMPFLPRLISGTYPDEVNIYVLYTIYLINTVLGYFLFAYKASLFVAHQRDDIQKKISSSIYIIQNIAQIIVLFLVKNYYAYIIILPIATILTNIAQEIWTKRLYPDLFCEGKLDHEERKDLTKRVTGLLSYQIGGVIYNNADMIVISSFLGLVVLAQYTNYYYIFSAITGLITIASNAITASVGNYIATESVETNARFFNTITKIFNWIVGWCSICFLCLYQPFIELWMGQNNLLPFLTAAIISLYFYTTNICPPVSIYKNAAGIWWEDRIRPLIGTTVNLALNLVLVQFIGLNGVILSSIISTLFISVPWSAYYLFKCYLKLNIRKYLFRQAFMLMMTSTIALATYLICTVVNVESLLICIIIRFSICLIVPNVMYLMLYKLTGSLNEVLEFANRMLKREIMNG